MRVGGASLIALDWGSSSLRAYRLGRDGTVLDTRSSDAGASRLAAQAAPQGKAALFESHLRALVEDWRQADAGVPLLACGMVGSAHGWVEAAYVECPADLNRLHRHLAVARGTDGLLMQIVPGLAYRPATGAPDVMRGEETQVVGILRRRPDLADDVCILLPGTHGKFVDVRGGTVVAFQTRMTGELFELLRTHSVLGRLMSATTAPAFDGGAFDRGVDAGRAALGADLAHRLFSVRSLGLFNELPSTGLAGYLSGLLIGHELAAALPQAVGRPLVLGGDAALCRRYQRALQRCDRAPAPEVHDSAADGLWAVAGALGLV